MGEPSEYIERIRKLDWGQLFADLVLHGVKHEGLSADLAQLLAAETVARVCDPARSPWDPSRGAQMSTHLRWVYRSVFSHHFAKIARQNTRSFGDHDEEPAPASQADPHLRAERSQRLMKWRERLMAAVEGRPLARQLVLLEEEEQITSVEEQVARTGGTRAQVYEARRFLAETARTILAELDHPVPDEPAHVSAAGKREAR